MRLAHVFSGRGKENEIKTGIISAQGDFTPQEQLLLRNLARLEHLRWNAAHEVTRKNHYE